jgi:hypothetical protein
MAAVGEIERSLATLNSQSWHCDLLSVLGPRTVIRSGIGDAGLRLTATFGNSAFTHRRHAGIEAPAVKFRRPFGPSSDIARLGAPVLARC